MAAAWDCPVTVKIYGLAQTKRHPRIDDLFETIRRWEDVRARNLLTPAQKEMLKDPAREFHLTPDGKGGYDLVEWRQLKVAGGFETDVRAFLHEWNGRRIVTYWHTSGRGMLTLPDGTRLDAENMKTFETDLSSEAVRAAFAAAKTTN